LLDALISAAPWLNLADHERLCRLSDHAVDAVVAAPLLARAVARGFTEMPEGTDRASAGTEGWIALPFVRPRRRRDIRRGPEEPQAAERTLCATTERV
jgi:hypothetical protein